MAHARKEEQKRRTSTHAHAHTHPPVRSGGRDAFAAGGLLAAGAHEDEANAAQLWSTVYLAIPPPAADIAPACR